VVGRGARPKNVVYPRAGDPCTEPRFMLYVAGKRDELRLMAPFRSERRLRRFIRDYAKSMGGLPHSVSFWRSSWR